jgi:pyruvate formate lyase activating enzyme
VTTIQPRWWSKTKGPGDIDVARCGLCFRNCYIKVGEAGFCGARCYAGDCFESPFLGKFTSIAVDPIEKKPLYYWRPGTKILSLGSIRCNFVCQFCQNHSIAHPQGERRLEEIPPAKLLETAKEHGLHSVAYTYNEPTLQAEYILTSAPLLKENDIASVMVTNGSFSSDVRNELALWVEAMNIDVKTFDDKTYAKLGGSLDAVKANVEALVGSGVHIELTHLVVPGISDSEHAFKAMVDWIADMSPNIPLHISRYFPAYEYFAPPTDVALMKKFLRLALEKLKRVHLGNVW